MPVKPCTAGFLCAAGTTTPVVPCPLAHECPEGAPLPVQCEAGTFAGSTGLAVCTNCTAGHYCTNGTTFPVTW